MPGNESLLTIPKITRLKRLEGLKKSFEYWNLGFQPKSFRFKQMYYIECNPEANPQAFKPKEFERESFESRALLIGSE